MKKLLVFFSIFGITTLPAMAYTDECVKNRQTDGFLAFKYSKLPDSCKTPLRAEFNKPFTEQHKFTCNYESYTCSVGDLPENCAPCAMDVLITEQRRNDFATAYGQIACDAKNNDIHTLILDVSEAEKTQWIDQACKQIFGQNNSATINAANTATSAETMTISGTILDENSEPVIGAHVIPEKTTEIGTTTDLNGSFKMDNFPADQQITISYMGYETTTVSPSTKLSIKLKPTVITLNEVNITASNIGRNCITSNQKPSNATAATWQMVGEQTKCVASACECGYDLKNGICNKGTKCISVPEHATKTQRYCNGQYEACRVLECKEGWKPDENGDACIEKLKSCTADQQKQHPNAVETGIDEKEQCIATECKCGYEVKSGKCVTITDTACTSNTKPKLPKNAVAATKACGDNGKTYCKITKCADNYKLNETTNKCEKLSGETCTHDDPNVKTAKYEMVNNKLTCVIKKCNDGYLPDNNGTKCEVSEGPCSESQVKAIENATAGELKKGKCYATACASGFEVSKGACISIGGDCADKPENAKKAHREFDTASNSEVCIIDECKSGYSVSDDKKSCTENPKAKLSKEDSEKQIAELRENAQKMKDKEQSTENKLLGAVGMGATGIGLMQTMSASAEQSADEDAEQDMKAYLATMHCNYGGGKNIVGGEMAVELPGGNELTPLYAEYLQLASDLKIRKTALDMRPGIESEVVFDKTQTGLYDDIATGKTGGAYTSLARALSDETSADAVAWAQQKADTADKKKTGLIIAGTGAVASLAGNLAINSGKNKQDKTDEILAKYEPLKQIFQQVEQEQRSLPVKKCSEFTGTTGSGTAPNCTCTNENAYFNMEQGCVDCTNGYTVNINKDACECTPPRVKSNGQCIEKAQECNYTGLVKNPTSADCTCAQYAVADSQNICDCDYNNGFTEDNAQCVCSTAENKEIKDNKCVCKTGYQDLDNNGTCEEIATILTKDDVIAEINIKADTTFASGSAKISNNKAEAFLDDFNNKLSEQSDLLKNNDYCVKITGHTDRTQFKEDSTWNNPRLSLARANAVKNVLIKNNTIPAANIQTSGAGETECPKATYPQPNDESCRRVNVQVVAGKCK